MSSVLCNYQLDHLESFFNSLHLTENIRSNYTQRRRVLRLTPLPNLVILSCSSVSCLSPHPPISLTHTHIFSLSPPLSRLSRLSRLINTHSPILIIIHHLFSSSPFSKNIPPSSALLPPLSSFASFPSIQQVSAHNVR